MRYYAKITEQIDNGYLVEFPDLPGCLTEGSTIKKAIKNAKEALNGWLTANCDRDLNIPLAKIRKGKFIYSIPVNLSVAFAIRLRQFRRKKCYTQMQVAKKLEISQQAYAKLELPLKSNPSLKTIQNIGQKLGIEIELVLL
jgi:predicted RNase H-like HicB family nuclease/DNA-binding XRE family transcriptional regulator